MTRIGLPIVILAIAACGGGGGGAGPSIDPADEKVRNVGDIVATTSAGRFTTAEEVATPPAGADTLGFEYPVGFLAFDIEGLADGQTIELTLDLPEGVEPTAYVKCTPTCAVFPGAVINGNQVVLTLQDGGAGDSGGVDGKIVDPGAPAIPDNGGGGGGSFGTIAYEVAERCVVLKVDGAYVTRQAAPGQEPAPTVAGLSTRGATAANAEKFRMRPTGLNRFLFFTMDEKFMTGDGPIVHLADAPSDGADWTVTTGANGFTANVGSLALAHDSNTGFLYAGPTSATIVAEDVAGCETTYPEMPVGIAETFTGPTAGPLVGFADIHAHMAMGSDMSDGSGGDGPFPRGPSAGGVMYGHAVNRFGVTEALKDCVDFHGPGGMTTAEIVLDLSTPPGPDPDEYDRGNPGSWSETFNQQLAENQAAVLANNPYHETAGWPSFTHWPAKDSQLHQQMYWKWVERAYMAGLRLMVLHGTNIEALCDVAKKTRGDKNADCTDMGVGMKQVAYAHDMQDYIDGYYGGPGKGWFRIVGTPAEAEAVIRAGKMAVVPGLEFSNIFKCNVTYVERHDGGIGEVVGCNKETIDQQIEEAWAAGVRGIFLYHDVDSALGGTGIFSEVLNLVNYHATKGFWDTYTCNDGPPGAGPEHKWGDAAVHKGYFYGAGAEMLGMEGFNGPTDPIGIRQQLIENANGLYPVYPAGNQCNKRGITELGRYALAAAMKKGFVLDIDHAEISIKQAMLDEGARTTPAYPMVSAHGGHGGITNTQARQILEQGGLIYPGMVNGREYTGFVEKVRAIWNDLSPAQKRDYPLAVGYGADQNGLANQPGPRRMPFTPVDYEAGITLFDPTDAAWAHLSGLGIAPVAVTQLTIPEGKSWDVDEHGVAHYGMVADVVEQIRQESAGDTKYLDALYRSADAYVRMWYQTIDASGARPPLAAPDPAKVPPMVPHPLDPHTGSLPPSMPSP